MSSVDLNLSGTQPPARPGRGDSFHVQLRSATRLCHDEVDGLFGEFDLTQAESYGNFLIAHALALIPVEDWADCAHLLPGWTGRKAALYADLTALGRRLPPFEPLDWPREDAARWGAAYVLEGSRLGGAMLSRQIGEGLPGAYLGSVHPQGAWKAFLAKMDARADGDPVWQATAIASAERTFALYARAAGLVGGR